MGSTRSETGSVFFNLLLATKRYSLTHISVCSRWAKVFQKQKKSFSRCWGNVYLRLFVRKSESIGAVVTWYPERVWKVIFSKQKQRLIKFLPNNGREKGSVPVRADRSSSIPLFLSPRSLSLLPKQLLIIYLRTVRGIEPPTNSGHGSRIFCCDCLFQDLFPNLAFPLVSTPFNIAHLSSYIFPTFPHPLPPVPTSLLQFHTSLQLRPSKLFTSLPPSLFNQYIKRAILFPHRLTGRERNPLSLIWTASDTCLKKKRFLC